MCSHPGLSLKEKVKIGVWSLNHDSAIESSDGCVHLNCSMEVSLQIQMMPILGA